MTLNGANAGADRTGELRGVSTGHALPAMPEISAGRSTQQQDLFQPEPPRLPTEQEIDEWMAQLPF